MNVTIHNVVAMTTDLKDFPPTQNRRDGFRSLTVNVETRGRYADHSENVEITLISHDPKMDDKLGRIAAILSED